jgi:hypothetical protein
MAGPQFVQIVPDCGDGCRAHVLAPAFNLDQPGAPRPPPLDVIVALGDDCYRRIDPRPDAHRQPGGNRVLKAEAARGVRAMSVMRGGACHLISNRLHSLELRVAIVAGTR